MQNKQVQTGLFWFGMIMAAAFICCGFLFLLNDSFLGKLPKTNRMVLGIVFIVYGAFRATRQYSRHQKLKQGPDVE